MPVVKGRVAGKIVNVLRDIGSSGIVVIFHFILLFAKKDIQK